MLWLWLFFTMITIGCIIAVLHGKIKAGVAIGVILVIGAIDVLRVDSQFIKIINPQPYFAVEPALQDLRDKMAQVPFRCFSIAGALPQNAEGIHGLEGVGGFHDNELCWYREFRGDQRDRNYYENLVGQTGDGQAYLISENLKNGNNFLNLANAKYYLIRQGRDLLSIKNEGALERLSFAAGYVVIDSSRIIDALKNNGTISGRRWRLRRNLTRNPDVRPVCQSAVDSLGARASLLSVQWEKYTPNCRKAAVDAQADGIPPHLRSLLSRLEGQYRREAGKNLSGRRGVDGGQPAPGKACRGDDAVLPVFREGGAGDVFHPNLSLSVCALVDRHAGSKGDPP